MPSSSLSRQNMSNQRKPPGKKPVPGPTHLGHFLMVLMMKICRSILFVDPAVKVFIYFGLIMTLSVVSFIFIVPKSYLSNKRNVFNDYFLKKGWGWTLFCVGSYIFFSSLVYCSRDFSKMCKQGMRLVFGTFWWYFCTKTFMKVESVAGSCSDSQYENPKACYVAGKVWKGFDISGHVFLEVYCSLLILEELKTFKLWKKLGILLDDEELKDKPTVSAADIDQSKSDYQIFTPFIKATVILVAVISVLFDFMLITSVVYPFHTLSEEIFAFFVAVSGWALSYHVLFHSHIEHSVMPCSPGEFSPFNLILSRERTRSKPRSK